jgi:hypothetical protein
MVNHKNRRHPELVSGSIVQQRLAGRVSGWMLKQVQHDGIVWEDSE